MLTLQEFEKIIENDLVYQQELLYYIDTEGKERTIKDLGHLHSLFATQNCSIRLEGLDYYNKSLYDRCLSLKHNGPVTCHAFRSFKNSKSFPEHTDPIDVFVEVIHGSLNLILNGKSIILNKGETISIPSNTKHQAINDEESLILSFGLEKFLIDKM